MTENKPENTLEKAAKELNISLPSKKVFLPFRVIAFVTLLAGINLIAGTFTDASTNLAVYLLRIFLGLLALGIAYGILERKRWAVWLYGFLALALLFVNPVIAILPIAIVIYLNFKRNMFEISIFDIGFLFLLKKIGGLFRKPQLPA